MDRAENGELRIEVVFSPAPRTTRHRQLTMPPGSTLGDALRSCGLLVGEAAGARGYGIWGRRQPLSVLLRDGDRVEAYRALTVDPKEARRLRYKRQPKNKRPA